jgi:hypothetical protein
MPQADYSPDKAGSLLISRLAKIMLESFGAMD